MLDGIELKGRCYVVALGIDTDGLKHPLGLCDGSTENATVATTLLANLVERGLGVEQGGLVVIDGAKALRKAVRDVLGVHTPVQRCVPWASAAASSARWPQRTRASRCRLRPHRHCDTCELRCALQTVDSHTRQGAKAGV